MSSLRPDLPTVVVTLTPGGAEIGARLAATLGARHDARGADFDAVPVHLGALFQAGHPIIAVCAAGIVIRALAPLLGDKWSEPPVLALSEDGASVVPLLGGHHGANVLAARVGDALGTRADLTTAGDVRLGVALDEPPAGWRLENPLDAKPVAAALLAGKTGELIGMAPWLEPLVEHGRALGRPQPNPETEATAVLRVGVLPPLVYRRQSVVLGVGCARGCDPDELIALVGATLAEAGIAEGEVASIASIDLKSDEAAIHALARHLDVPARFFPAKRLEAETPRLANPSEVVFAEVGCHGVSEGAALVAGGGELLVEKRKSANATCAAARIEGGEAGTPRGSLAVVGIGPGDAKWRTPEATRLIAEADLLVGYGLYIDLLGPLAKGKPRDDFPLGGEEDRCRHALEEAGKGRRVALICSGDAGIYAMGALVMELLDREVHGVSEPARRVEVIHAPGISALQAASARSGAMLGHDFCAISLSDLLTPRDVITKRIKAAAEGDFVIAFYNPVSRRRRTLLAEARETLLQHRPADTPVLLASSLGRPEESLRLRRLADLQVDEVDMLTIVMIGAAGSKVVASGDRSAGAGGQWIYTPRGYAKKLETTE